MEINKMLLDIWGWLSGKKTYIVGVAGLIWGWATGNDEVVYMALGFLGLRHGMNK